MHRFLLKKIFYLPTIIFLLTISSCEKSNNSIIDSAGIAPVISNPHLSVSVINTDTINIGTARKPDDLLTLRAYATVKVTHSKGQGDIKTVNYSVFKNFSVSPSGEGVLHDDGIFPDIIKNDSIFSGVVEFQVYRVDVGTYWATFTSESQPDYKSNTVLLPIQVIRLNHTPLISNLQAPDTLYHGGYLKLTVQVSDSDGLGDIFSVGYFSLKPNGTYANNGNLILMFDDGKPSFPDGDATANDGVYTYSDDVPFDADIGTYTFTFYAVDRSEAHSDTIIHTLVIK